MLERRVSLTFLLFSFVLAGCSGTIMKKFDTKDGKSVTTGPRQRAIINREVAKASRPGLVDPENIICAEPSPDVAVALASAFGGSASVPGSGNAGVSFSQSEGIVQLAERTVSIQLLRDQMYRTCEAYANGAISGTTYTMTMNRMNDTMVTLLIGEAAAGAMGRSLAAIGGKASSEAEASMQGVAGAVRSAEAAVEKYVATEQVVSQAQTELNDKKELLKTAPKDKEKQKEVEAAQAKYDEAVVRRDLAKEQLKTSAEAATKAAAEISKVEAGGGIEINESAELARVLGQMQARFIKEASNDEYLSTCLVELGNASHDTALSMELKRLLDEWWAGADSPDDTLFVQRLQQTILNRYQHTALAKHCLDNLEEFVAQEQENRFHLAEYEAEARLNHSKAKLESAQAQGINSFKGAIDACSSLDDPSRAGPCVTTAIRLAGQGKNAAAPRPGPRATVLPLVIYRKAMRLKTEFDKAVPELAGATPTNAPTVPTLSSNPTEEEKLAYEKAKLLADKHPVLINQKTALTNQMTALQTDATTLFGQIDVGKITTLQSKLPNLQGEYLSAETDAERDRLSMEIGIQQATATEYHAKYKELANRLRDQTTAARTLVAAIGAYNEQVAGL